MSGETLSFSAAVDAWCRETDARMTAVLRESCQRLVSEAQVERGHGGNMPVQTGFLRASGLASKDAPIPINPNAKPDKDAQYTFNLAQVSVVLSTLQPGETFYFSWTAAYARVAEYGGPDRAAAGFVRLAAQNWPVIVRASIAEARARAGQT